MSFSVGPEGDPGMTHGHLYFSLFHFQCHIAFSCKATGTANAKWEEN